MVKPLLNPRQLRFVREYLVDLNATAAYKRAGYVATGTSAEVNASRLLGQAKVAEAVRIAMDKREKRTEITQDRVLKELARLAFFDIRKLYRADGSLKCPADLDDDAAAALSGIDVVEMAGGLKIGEDEGAQHVPMYTKKARLFDKNASLALAMRHLGMLVDKTELTGKNGEPLTGGVFVLPAILTPAEWEAAAKAQQEALRQQH